MQPHPSTLAHTLYRPEFEHDSCGTGFIARLCGDATHEIVTMGLTALARLAHRGALHADARTGDGAGLLTQIPHRFLAHQLASLGLEAPPRGQLGVGMLFLPRQADVQDRCRQLVEAAIAREGLSLLAWRAVPIDPSALGANAEATRPEIQQVLVACSTILDEEAFERRLYLVRRAIEREAIASHLTGLYLPAFSCRTIVYKGMLAAPQLANFYPDLTDPAYESAIALFHQRYSTNTFPAWERAQPLRMMGHNGEINTLSGNTAWFRAREASLASEGWGDRLADLTPVLQPDGSDSSQFDNVLELLVRSGRNLPHALMMMVPEAWEKVSDLAPAWRAFYDYHGGLMEPWDGPAAICYTDGRWIGCALDRNGLRPARYVVTTDGLVVSASETGVLDLEPARIARSGMLGPGEAIAVDLETNRFLDDRELKDEVVHQAPYEEWLSRRSTHPEPIAPAREANPLPLAQRQAAFGYTQEDLAVILRPILQEGAEPVGSMGDDTPHAILSPRWRGLFGYFKQRFAEVTNPPIDPLREEWVMSLSVLLGERRNLLAATADHARLIRLPSPFLRDEELLALERRARHDGFGWQTLPMLWPAGDPSALADALEALCSAAERAIATGAQILVLSDRDASADLACIPSLLATAAVHHHLIRVGKRMKASLVVDSGEPREVHQLAALLGYGANAICPYLALETMRALAAEERKANPEPSDADAESHFLKAAEKGLLKVMAKMGISAVSSYAGAQLFEALGIGPEVITRYFPGTPSPLGGIGLEAIATATLDRHHRGFPAKADPPALLEHPGFYKVRPDGEPHAFGPDLVKALHEAVTVPDVLGGGFAEGYARYKAWVSRIEGQGPIALRDMLRWKPGHAIPLDQVEPAGSLFRRFSTGAMSHGSLGSEAHETLAIAMNRLGGMSNSGEGGEDPSRFGTERNSRIKQVASARFGVTPAYLQSADELQIKMAQGSKPGEGGQLPARKVTEEIARLRHTAAGIPLISPPPHHDIYSIEDLAELIHDLREANPHAAISVKLVAQSGVGTIAAGVAKAHADVIHIGGHAGGTGASPLGSIKHAGSAWELGLAETHQTLVANGLRGRVRLRVDGGLRTGRDVVLAAMLGADEVSFGTVALIAEGCKMVRACHNNSCPVGIATQRPELRAKFPGNPERVMAYMRFVAEEVREILAELGVARLSDLIGRTDLLEQVSTYRTGADHLDLAPLLAQPLVPSEWPRRFQGAVGLPPANRVLAEQIVGEMLPDQGPLPAMLGPYPISNTDRAIGTLLAGELVRRYGNDPSRRMGTTLTFEGQAGQSFGAFAVSGMRLRLVGEANDYVGKGLGGAEIVVRPASYRQDILEDQIAGNTVLYGATSGRLFSAGRAGGRFAVRNSGAVAVVEGVGDHACEYMTGGAVLVLGAFGRNFGAGMTGGQAYVLDEDGHFPTHGHLESVEASPLRPMDETIVRHLLSEHLRLTQSPRAREILENWGFYRSRFRFVTPRVERGAIAPPPTPLHGGAIIPIDRSSTTQRRSL